MTIHFFEVHEWEQPYLERRAKELFPDAELHFDTALLNESTVRLSPGVTCLSIFVESRVTKTVLDQFPDLTCIATRSTGFDMIDLAAAKERGITVMNVPSYGEHTVAEFTFGLILSLSRRLLECVDRTRVEGTFVSEGLTGFDLVGKTLGVIGTGRIGIHVVEIAQAFGMKVVAFDVMPRPELAEKMSFTYTTLDELLATSDIVTLHVPASPHGGYLIGAAELAKMKQGAYLVNTARGVLVDTAALLTALTNTHLAGAALDVLEHEQEVATPGSLRENPLVALSNVIVTPHTAFNTREAIERILETALQNTLAFANGTPQNVVGN